MKTIQPQQLQELTQTKKVLIVDVRDPDEYAYKHIAGSLNMPLDNLEHEWKKLPADQDIYLICKSGARSSKACDTLSSFGLERAYSVAGGIGGFEAAGGLVAQTRKTLPLMQQVQIAAGSLVLLSIILSQTISPLFVWLAAFVGAGLTFAGITGYCGMALVLAKMPWNKTKGNA